MNIFNHLEKSISYILSSWNSCSDLKRQISDKNIGKVYELVLYLNKYVDIY